MDQYLLGYMEKVREYYRQKKTYGKNLKADDIIRRILGRPGIENQIPQDIPIQGDLELNKLLQNREGMNSTWSIPADRPITSHRKVIGKFIVFGKKVVRKLLRWYINPIAEDQTRFNGYATSGINEITNKMLIMERNFKVIDRKIREIEKQLEKLSLLSDLKDELYQQKADLSYLSYRFRQIQGEFSPVQLSQYDHSSSDFSELDRTDKPSLKKSSAVKSAENKNKRSNQQKQGILPDHLEADYFLFENRFRGSEDKIKESLRNYLPWFKGRQNILDIGCGRGEFLELMKENNIPARGIDINQEFVNYCREKGLDVDLGDGISILQELEDSSLGGIFMGQVIEHLEPDYLTRLLKLAVKKLKPGAYLVAETPNPTMLSTFSNSFYLDLSHVKPVHPETMRYLMEYYGFKDIEIKYSQSSKIPYSLALLQAKEGYISNLKSFNEGINLLNDLLFGYQDYVIAGKKPQKEDGKNDTVWNRIEKDSAPQRKIKPGTGGMGR